MPVRGSTAVERRRLLDHKLRSHDDAAGPGPAARAEPHAVSARSRELLGLLPVALLVTAGFTAVFMARQSDLGSTTLTWGGDLPGALPGGAPVHPRALPDADPYLFPLVALLAAFGLVMIYRIDDDARAPAGRLVRGRDRRSSSAPSCCCATSTCSSAIAT